jgi:uncharacterized protein
MRKWKWNTVLQSERLAAWRRGLIMDVINNIDLERFEIALDGDLAIAEYTIEGKDIFFTHTEVPTAYEGQGIGSRLAFAALEFAKSQGFTVHAHCHFIASYIRRHPEYQSITWGYEDPIH